MGISTRDVLAAAKTKWNFLPFEPGLVGGHCIGVDPYYLAYKAEELGHHPQIIMAGRRINDAMGKYFAREFIKKLIAANIKLNDAKVLVMGMTFKENCPDIRNSKVITIIDELKEYHIKVDVWEPVADAIEVSEEYGVITVPQPKPQSYDGIVLAVKHQEFVTLGLEGIRNFLVPNGVLYDIKEIF
jgi:UDP-N-acetyl-D-galactosamine dehydrogenase